MYRSMSPFGSHLLTYRKEFLSRRIQSLSSSKLSPFISSYRNILPRDFYTLDKKFLIDETLPNYFQKLRKEVDYVNANASSDSE